MCFSKSIFICVRTFNIVSSMPSVFMTYVRAHLPSCFQTHEDDEEVLAEECGLKNETKNAIKDESSLYLLLADSRDEIDAERAHGKWVRIIYAEVIQQTDALCVACCTRPRDTAFLPCGHVIACSKCIEKRPLCWVCDKGCGSLQLHFL